MTPIEVVEDAQKKVSNGIALLASADSRRMEFPTQVAQKEEEERGVSSGMRGAAIHKHYQAEEVVNKGSKEGQATEGWRLGKSATSRVTPGGTPGGVTGSVQGLEGGARRVLAALTDISRALEQREHWISKRERLLEIDHSERVALAHHENVILDMRNAVLQKQLDVALKLVEAAERLGAVHCSMDVERARLGGSESEAAEMAVPGLVLSSVQRDQSVRIPGEAEEPPWLEEAERELVASAVHSGPRARGAGWGRRHRQQGRGDSVLAEAWTCRTAQVVTAPQVPNAPKMATATSQVALAPEVATAPQVPDAPVAVTAPQVPSVPCNVYSSPGAGGSEDSPG